MTQSKALEATVTDPLAPNRSWTSALSTAGIAGLAEPYPSATIRRWNTALDPLFATSSGPQRSYVGADRLAQLEIITDLLSPSVQALIRSVTPDAVVYHCHAYEIDGGQDRPHIRAEYLAGWHRDEETIGAYDPYAPRYISLFVYLTDVGPGGGAFELVPRLPGRGLSAGLPAVSLTGPAGTVFVWNRSYFHRASPNRSPGRRRVLKLSWQPIGLEHDRMYLPELVAARESLSVVDPFTAAFFADRGPGEALLPDTRCQAPPAHTLLAESGVDIKLTDELLGRLWALRHSPRRHRFARSGA